jgi:hypothetical protein
VQAVSVAGTSGQVLQSNGASAPTWVTASAGALTFLSSVTASASATVDIETTFNSTYDNYLIIASGVTFSSAGGSLGVRMKIGGSYLDTSTYYGSLLTQRSDSSTFGVSLSNGTTSFFVATEIGTGAAEPVNFHMRIYNPSSTTLCKRVDMTGSSVRSAGALASLAYGHGGNSGTGALTGIRFLPSGGVTMTTGTFRLYGIANS